MKSVLKAIYYKEETKRMIIKHPEILLTTTHIEVNKSFIDSFGINSSKECLLKFFKMNSVNPIFI